MGSYRIFGSNFLAILWLLLSLIVPSKGLFAAAPADTNSEIKGEVLSQEIRENAAVLRLATSVHIAPQLIKWCNLDCRYRNEQLHVKDPNRCRVFPTAVRYLSEARRAPYEVYVENGKIMQHGQPFSSSSLGYSWDWDVIFVVSKEMKIYTGRFEKGTFHHSSFLSGNEVQTAGHWLVVDGELKKINNCSGHYLPSPLSLHIFLRYLQTIGVNIDMTSISYKQDLDDDIGENIPKLLSSIVPVREINPELVPTPSAKQEEKKWDLTCPIHRSYLQQLIIDGDSDTLGRELELHPIAGDGLFDFELTMDGSSALQPFEVVKMNLIHFALERSARPEIFLALQKAGLDFNQPDSYGRLPLGIILRNEPPTTLVEKVRFFLQRGANPSLSHGRGQVSLPLIILTRHFPSSAISKEAEKVLRHTVYNLLCQAGGRLKDKELLDYNLIEYFDLIETQVLASPELVKSYLFRAIKEHKVEVVRYLLDNCSTKDLNKQNSGLSLLQYASYLATSKEGQDIFEMMSHYQKLHWSQEPRE